MMLGGTALCALTGGAAAPFLVAAGVIGGGIQVGKGVINAATATTDAEAKAAFEDIGGGASGIALSVIGAKASAKAAGIEGVDDMNALQATKACFEHCGSKIGGLFKGSSGVAGAASSASATSAASEAEAATVSENSTPASESVVKETTETPNTSATAEQATATSETASTTNETSVTTEKQAVETNTPKAKKSKTAQEMYDNGYSDTKVAKKAKAERLAHKQDKALTPENQNSPQADSYKLADKTSANNPEYLEHKAQRNARVNEKFSNTQELETQVSTLEKRVANAKTTGSKKALNEQLKVAKERLAQAQGKANVGETQPAKLEVKPQTTTTAADNIQLSGKDLKTFKSLKKMSQAELADWIEVNKTSRSNALITKAESLITPETTPNIKTPVTQQVHIENPKGAQSSLNEVKNLATSEATPNINETPVAQKVLIENSQGPQSEIYQIINEGNVRPTGRRLSPTDRFNTKWNKNNAA